MKKRRAKAKNPPPTDAAKGKPIPTRFDPPEEEALDEIKRRYGLSKSEIIRRGMRIVAKRFKETNDATFLIRETEGEYGKGPSGKA